MKNMGNKYLLGLALCFVFLVQNAYAQDDLMNLLEENSPSETTYTFATFKSNRLINGHTIEMVGTGELNFVISHKFGKLNSGAYEFFGLDNAHIRLGLEYGLTDRLNIGVGRNSLQKIYDGYIKYQVLKQSSGTRQMPVSVTALSSVALTTLRQTIAEMDVETKHRMSYVGQLLIARKFSSALSLQLSPTWVHHNLVETAQDDNDQFALGMGGRYKITKRTSLNLEYYYQLNPNPSSESFNALALGFDIETGGHVFQLHVTNAQAMIEKSFITETTGDFFKGDLHFGFSISRGFDLIKKDKKPNW